MANVAPRTEALSADEKDFLRGQAGSLGSGVLGGWSEVAFGGSFGEGPAVDEVRNELRRLTRKAAGEPEGSER